MNLKTDDIDIETYRRVVDNLPHGIIVSDAEGKFIIWNEKALPMFPDGLFQSKQENWVEDFGVYQIDKITKYKTEELPMSKALKGVTTANEKMYIQHGEKEGIFLKVSSYPIYNCEHDELEAGVVLIEDITQEQILYDNIINKINELENYLKDIMDFDFSEKIKKYEQIS